MVSIDTFIVICFKLDSCYENTPYYWSGVVNYVLLTLVMSRKPLAQEIISRACVYMHVCVCVHVQIQILNSVQRTLVSVIKTFYQPCLSFNLLFLFALINTLSF